MKNLILKPFSILAISAVVFTACDSKDSEAPYQLPTLTNLGVELPYTTLFTTSNGVEIRNGGFGSAATAHPTNVGEFYAMTDRGPNIDYVDGKMFPLPNYNPKIGHFKLTSDGKIELLKIIELKNPSGALITGLPNPVGKGSTGETAYSLDLTKLGTDDYGLDSEGLVAMKDGTFWVSDEYGPHIVHFSAEGKELERISPTNVLTGFRKIPAVFERRWANRGMEGLAITPDEKMLVGIMQSTLYNPSKAAVADYTITRIVTFELATGKTKQYLYKQEIAKNANSEIVALSNTEFLVVERDGLFTGSVPNSQKHIYKISIANATDVSADDFNSIDGKLVNGKTIEQNTWAELEKNGIKPVTKTLAIDLVNKLGDYPHDKLEGIWLINNNTLGVINDDDFVVSTGKNGELVQKILPNSTKKDAGTLYIVKF